MKERKKNFVILLIFFEKDGDNSICQKKFFVVKILYKVDVMRFPGFFNILDLEMY